MFAALRDRITFANVVSLIALFVALGGTSVAAISLTRNSVKPRHIAPNAVSSPKVKDRSLRARDFAGGQLPSGPKGDKGDKGEPGSQGQAGAPGSAMAFARVRSDGVLDQTRSKGVNGVQSGFDPISGLFQTYIYCFDLQSAAKNAVAVGEAVDSDGNGPIVTQAAVPPDVASSCLAPYTDAIVVTFRSKSGQVAPGDFYVAFN